jgi:hypothetical protein
MTIGVALGRCLAPSRHYSFHRHSPTDVGALPHDLEPLVPGALSEISLRAPGSDSSWCASNRRVCGRADHRPPRCGSPSTS